MVIMLVANQTHRLTCPLCISIFASGKCKVHPKTGHEGPEGCRGKLNSFFNFDTREGGWSTPRPGRFTPGKETRYPLYRGLGGPQGRCGQVRKIVQPVASRYRLPDTGPYQGPLHFQ